MKNKTIIIVGIIIIVGVFTNPNEQAHKNKIKELFNSSINEKELLEPIEIDTNIDVSAINDTAYKLGASLGSQLALKTIENGTTVDNYLIFSLTNYRGHYAGFGILGNVYLSKRLKSAFEINL